MDVSPISEVVQRLEELAREHFDTTPGDVVNATRAGNLRLADVPDEFVNLIGRLPADHPIITDDDPDDRLGWCWDEKRDGPVAERPT